MRQLTLLLLRACAGCTASTSSPPVAQAAPGAAAGPAARQSEDAASLLVRIRNGIGGAACTDSAQCKTLPVGARACGGPEGYLAYSTAVKTPESLTDLAARHAERRRTSVAASGMISTCEIKSDPGAICIKGACQLRTGVNNPV